MSGRSSIIAANVNQSRYFGYLAFDHFHQLSQIWKQCKHCLRHSPKLKVKIGKSKFEGQNLKIKIWRSKIWKSKFEGQNLKVKFNKPVWIWLECFEFHLQQRRCYFLHCRQRSSVQWRLYESSPLAPRHASEDHPPHESFWLRSVSKSYPHSRFWALTGRCRGHESSQRSWMG